MTVLVYTNWPDEKSALDAANVLVAEHLIACANLMPMGRSVYHWQGKVCTESEVIMLMKTARDRVGEVKKRVLALHPYDLPAFSVLPIDTRLSHLPFVNWINEETQP